MIGRKTLSEIRAELEAALCGPGGMLAGPPKEGDAPEGEVVASLRRFLATMQEGGSAKPPAKAEIAKSPASRG